MGTIDELGIFRVVAYLIVCVQVTYHIVQGELLIAFGFVLAMIMIRMFSIDGEKTS